MIHPKLKAVARIIRDTRPWMRGHGALVIGQLYHRARNQSGSFSDLDHMRSAARWLEFAQDAAGNGGVMGRYALDGGWSSAYPETTGYILSTFLALAESLGEERFRRRAQRCSEFLLPLQLESGAFPGGEVAENLARPSPFNTAQILHGLLAWHRAAGDEQALDAARRAGDWLLSVQDEDGAFRKHFYLGVAATYSAHASCWIAELGRQTGDARYLEAAERHLDWTLAHADRATGWFDLAGFDAESHSGRYAFTHTIAYTLAGVLRLSEWLERPDGIEIVTRAADGIARRFELSRRLPSVLNHQWRSRADGECLTGNAQMALIWMQLHGREPNLRFLNAALGAIDRVKRAQPMDSSNPALCGAVPGSDPIWGPYIPNALPNWSAKFFIDALLEKARTLQALKTWPGRPWTPPPDLPAALPEVAESRSEPNLKVVYLTSPESTKPAQMRRAWEHLGIAPRLLVVEQESVAPARERLARRVREDGLGPMLRRWLPETSAPGVEGGIEPELPRAMDLARDPEIEVVEAPALASREAVDVLRALEPDLAVHAGAGILRAPILSIPRLGTLNAHMGVLPFFRGMNVAEWAALHGGPVGCTVHLIDSGIDTGDILCVRTVELAGVGSIAELRERVDEAQLQLLGEVLRYILRTGALPPRRPHAPADGEQFFRMHPELQVQLTQVLRQGQSPCVER